MLSVQKPNSFDLFQHLHKISQIITVITKFVLRFIGHPGEMLKRKHLNEAVSPVLRSFSCMHLEITSRELCGRTLLTFNTLSDLWSDHQKWGWEFYCKILHNLLNKDELSWIWVKSFSIKVGTDDWHPCILLLAPPYNSFVASCAQAWVYSWNMSR